jgi:hypothetical protein
MAYNHKGYIHTLDSVWSVCETKIAKLIAEELSYNHVYWRKSFDPKKRGKKERVEKKVCMLECRGDDAHYFHTGFIPRVLSFCDRYKIPYEYDSDIESVAFDDPHIKGITFREYQKDALEAALQNGRGVLKAATGVGKSVVLAGLMSAFSEENILFLCHSTDLVKQIIDNYILEFKIGEYGEFSGSSKNLDKRITVATVQSFKNVVHNQMYHYDVVMIDECFVKGTKVNTVEGKKPIEEIKIGETLPVKKGTRKVLRTFKNKIPLEKLCKVTLSNGKTIFCSSDHLFKTKEGDVEAKNLNKKNTLNTL